MFFLLTSHHPGYLALPLLLMGHAFRLFNSARIFSAETGKLFTLMPVALNMAFVIAAMAGFKAGSPMPFAP